MTIFFNNNLQQIQEQTTVLLLLDQLMSNKQNGIAVAINETVIPKGQWNTYVLQPNDKVLVIKATQGG
ncbi:MAG TPA: sulfur carrier protein ThiS [Cytophagaceae bacterium]|jgi:sulfur carrier protein|nr:sulfur carrier protein ThiS [Cytophagaceae bacterium]